MTDKEWTDYITESYKEYESITTTIDTLLIQCKLLKKENKSILKRNKYGKTD